MMNRKIKFKTILKTYMRMPMFVYLGLLFFSGGISFFFSGGKNVIFGVGGLAFFSGLFFLLFVSMKSNKEILLFKKGCVQKAIFISKKRRYNTLLGFLGFTYYVTYRNESGEVKENTSLMFKKDFIFESKKGDSVLIFSLDGSIKNSTIIPLKEAKENNWDISI